MLKAAAGDHKGASPYSNRLRPQELAEVVREFLLS